MVYPSGTGRRPRTRRKEVKMKFTGTGQSGAGVHNATKFKENYTVATMTKSGKKTYESKSAHVRALLDEGKTIAEVCKLVPNMGYAFAYGIAKRYGKTETAAKRKATKVITRSETEVKIVTKVGVVIVNLETGQVSKKK
jgi:hypothetical protein